MIVKGIVDSKIGDNRYKVRVPVFDKIENATLSSNDLSIADVCSVTNSRLNLNINDVVYLNYENNDRSKPVIVGCLSKSKKSNYLFDSLIVDNSAKLPSNIKIGEITYKELSCLISSNDNIENQIISLNKDLSTISDNLEESSNNINIINKNISDIEISNEKINSNLSEIDLTLGNINDSVNNSFYGRYNDLLKNSNRLNNFVGNKDSTLSSRIEDILTKLITLRDYTPSLISEPQDNDTENNDDLVESIYDEEQQPWTNSKEFKDIINALRRKFPNGKYWNHAPRQGNTAFNGINNQDGYTDTPCPKHHNCGEKTQTCNGYAPNNYETSWQCMGYANKCGYDVTGCDPEWNSAWKKTTDANDLKKLKGGDIIRYKNDGHSIYVIDVSGSTITYTDCNSDGHCKIRWDAKIDKSDIKKTFTYIRISPTDYSKSRLIKH